MKEYAFYSGLVTQFIVIILIFVSIGYCLQKKYPETEPYSIVIFSLLGIGIAMYLLIKQVLRKLK